MMLRITKSFVLLYVFTISCHTARWTEEDHSSISEEMVKVSVYPRDGKSREKRSSEGSLPDSIKILVRSKTDQISLDLHKVTKRSSHIRPVILTATKQGLKEEDIPDLNVDTTFYQDVANRALVTLINKDGHNQTVRGNFVKDGYMHSLEPITDTRNTDSNTHRLTKHRQQIDFTGDAINFQETAQSSLRRRRAVGISANTSDSETEPRELYLEYVIVVDYENYKIWRDKISDNVTDEEKDKAAKTDIIQFYRHIANGIDVIINTASNLQTNLHVVLTGMVVCNESGASPWMDRHKICNNCSEVDDQKTLMDFYRWRDSVLLQRLDHDHASLFTGYDLYHTDMESDSTVGVSYVGTVCEMWSVSIMEERRNALSIHTAAHELGHSFGAYHDGTGPADACLGANKHIMQPKMSRIIDKNKAHNPWTFSPCSINSIMEYIDDLDSDDFNCLLNKPAAKLMQKPDKEPGVLHSADAQCQAMFGTNSSVCRGFHHHDWSSLCYGLACRNTETGLCKSVLPYDGTPCGYKKWCQQGLCEYNEEALGVSDLCPIGDDPSYTCTKNVCEDMHIYNGTCCVTCQTKMTSTPTEHTTYTVILTQPNKTDTSTASQNSFINLQNSTLDVRYTTEITTSVSTDTEQVTNDVTVTSTVSKNSFINLQNLTQGIRNTTEITKSADTEQVTNDATVTKGMKATERTTMVQNILITTQTQKVKNTTEVPKSSTNDMDRFTDVRTFINTTPMHKATNVSVLSTTQKLAAVETINDVLTTTTDTIAEDIMGNPVTVELNKPTKTTESSDKIIDNITTDSNLATIKNTQIRTTDSNKIISTMITTASLTTDTKHNKTEATISNNTKITTINVVQQNLSSVPMENILLNTTAVTKSKNSLHTTDKLFTSSSVKPSTFKSTLKKILTSTQKSRIITQKRPEERHTSNFPTTNPNIFSKFVTKKTTNPTLENHTIINIDSALGVKNTTIQTQNPVSSTEHSKSFNVSNWSGSKATKFTTIVYDVSDYTTETKTTKTPKLMNRKTFNKASRITGNTVYAVIILSIIFVDL